MDIRIVNSLPAPAAWNMAVDEALLGSAAATKTATLRFYRWDPPATSLGYFQSYRDRQQHAASQKCDWVRRSTGGGAIVHHHELTYSFTWPSPARGDTAPFYDAFHGSLVTALKSIGVTTHRCQRSISRDPEPFLCFQRRAQGDLLLGEHKVGGSAQRRRRNAAIQHGSLLWRRSEFAPELLGIADLASPQIDLAAFQDRWRVQLQETWNLLASELPSFGSDDTFTSGVLSADELTAASVFANEQFSSPQWNQKR